MIDGHRVAVVIPAHNEERLIARTIGSVPAFVDLVVVVDDASVDATLARAASCADPRLVVRRHARNEGVGSAIRTGYRVALELGAEVVAVMDGDGQMDPADLGALIAPVVSGAADFAKGCRFEGVRPRGRMPAMRLVGNLVLSGLTKLVTGHAGSLDSQCGYTALSAAAIARLPLAELYPRYGYTNDLVVRALEAGLRVVSVPVRAVYGSEVSGIRARVAIPRILALLARAAARRITRSLDGRTVTPAEITERP